VDLGDNFPIIRFATAEVVAAAILIDVVVGSGFGVFDRSISVGLGVNKLRNAIGKFHMLYNMMSQEAKSFFMR